LHPWRQRPGAAALSVRLGRRESKRQTPGCGELRSEFRGRESLIVEEFGACNLSGARTDVRLPNGDYLWAPYFLRFLQTGWLDNGFHYTEAYYEAHPHKRRS
jgi:hypothetical protein